MSRSRPATGETGHGGLSIGFDKRCIEISCTAALKEPNEWFGLLDAGAGTAGVDEASFGIVIGEQQRAEPWPGAFRIGLTDHHEFLAVQAFQLAPQAAVAGRVRGIDAFRDDALDR